jgi:hypothetical protein
LSPSATVKPLWKADPQRLHFLGFVLLREVEDLVAGDPLLELGQFLPGQPDVDFVPVVAFEALPLQRGITLVVLAGGVPDVMESAVLDFDPVEAGMVVVDGERRRLVVGAGGRGGGRQGARRQAEGQERRLHTTSYRREGRRSILDSRLRALTGYEERGDVLL